MKKKFEEMSITEKVIAGLCINHTAKMENMISFSTSALDNKYCKAYAADPNKICSNCYAQTQLKRQSNTNKKCVRNGFIKSVLMKESDVPFINAAYFRFESFGDLETVQQAYNYFLIAKCNPQTTFGLYTKNAFIIHNMLTLYDVSKPNNLVITESSPIKNKPRRPSYDFVDHVFTVYTKDYAKENNVPIHCGKMQCVHCLRCYKKDTPMYVNELKK